jgi:hypothetical protein
MLNKWVDYMSGLTIISKPRYMNSTISIITILVVALLSAIAASYLPDDPYQRFKLLDGTIYESLRRTYERIHYDPRPIDVAVIGPSKSELGISAMRIQRDLSVLGNNSQVENFSITADGRNIEWIIVKELYKRKSPKVLVISIDEEPFPWGHMAFKYAAPATDVSVPASPFLHNYFKDLVYLPFRQIELFGEMLLPDWFGSNRRFDPNHYARARSDFTSTFLGKNGEWVQMDVQLPRAKLISDYRDYLVHEKKSHMPKIFVKYDQADDRVYMDKIVQLANKHGTRIVFVFIPRFMGALSYNNRSYYERFGIIQDNSDIGQRESLYSGWPHVNHAGAMMISDRVAKTVAPAL